MPAASMMNKFARKVPPPSAEEGEPTDDMPRGVGGGAGSAGESKDPAAMEAQSIEDMSDILGVGPEDREDFGAALKAYVQACIESSMADNEAAEGEGEEPEEMEAGDAGPAYGS